MENLKNIITPKKRYKIISRYYFEITTIICPHCYSMTEVVIEQQSTCSVCNRAITPEELIGGNCEE